MVAAPDDARGPVASTEWLVVTDGRRRAAHISGLQRLRVSEKSVADLHRPVVVWFKRQPRRTRVPGMLLEVVTILIRLPAVEYRAFDFEPAISESSSQHAKTNVRGILKMM